MAQFDKMKNENKQLLEDFETNDEIVGFYGYMGKYRQILIKKHINGWKLIKICGNIRENTKK